VPTLEEFGQGDPGELNKSKECIINKSIDMKDRYILDRTNGGVDQSIEVERVSESWTKIRDEQ
jgi:hypothetical protein